MEFPTTGRQSAARPQSTEGRLEPIWPGMKYAPGIPTIQQVLGYEAGMEITPPHEAGVYLRALAEAAPERSLLLEYARSWEGRPLWLMVIGSPERMARLDEVKRDLQRLADPRGLSGTEADRLVKEAPVVTGLAHGTHGNELSPGDAALFEAYHLLAAQDDAEIEMVLRESLVLIDPMHNPDGRARFLFHHLQARAATPDPTPYSAEHDEPWPGGRTNHYHFDLNRDWFALTQPETRGSVRIGREFCEHVRLDLHEHGGEKAYFFGPPAEPINPHVTEWQKQAWELFAQASATHFDKRGWPYFLREIYDLMYPGYADCWQALTGVIGMTFEQAAARSLSYARADGTLMSYRDGVTRHVNAALVAMITAAKNRERILREYLEYRRRAVFGCEEEAQGDYLLLPGRDPSRADRLAHTLAAQGIEVYRATEALDLDGARIPAGTCVVPQAQLSRSLIKNLLDPRIEQPAEFVRRLEQRRARRLSDKTHDITAWNLPMLFGVELQVSRQPLSSAAGMIFVEANPVQRAVFARSEVAYLIPWGSAAAALTADGLQQGLHIQSVGGPFSLGERPYSIGTALVRVAGNPANLHDELTRLATKHGAEIVPVNATWVDWGTSLGSTQTVFLRPPRVLLAWDAPTFSQSAGWARHTLERRYGQPATIVRISSLQRVRFADFDVVVLPSGNYGCAISEELIGDLKSWVHAGGTLITLAEATRWATGRDAGLLTTTGLLKDGRPDVAESKAGHAVDRSGGSDVCNFDYDRAIQPDRERPPSQMGAILRIILDTDHWLSAGHGSDGYAIITGNRVFAPLKLDDGCNVGRWGARDLVLASGLIPPETQDLLAHKPFLMYQPCGRGQVIAFAEDPNFRGFSEGTMLLFMNAVLLGPAYRGHPAAEYSQRSRTAERIADD